MLLARLLVLSELGCVNTFSGVSCLVDVSSPSGPSGLADAWMQLLLRSSTCVLPLVDLVGVATSVALVALTALRS